MRDRNVGSVVVIDRIGCLVGIVTDRDLVLRAFAEGRSGDIAVQHVMTRDVVTVSMPRGRFRRGIDHGQARLCVACPSSTTRTTSSA